MAQTVQFIARPRADLGGVIEIVPAIDGAELTDLIHAFEQRTGMETGDTSYGGLIPAYFNFGPIELHFLGTSDLGGAGKKPLLGCSCGEWGCWPLLARIVVSEFEATLRAEEFVRFRDELRPLYERLSGRATRGSPSPVP